jgi:hypothetical protein
VAIHFSRIVTPSNIHMKTSHLVAITKFNPDRHNRPATQPLHCNRRDPNPNFASLRFVTIHFSRIVTPSNIHMKTSYVLAIAEFPADRHNHVPQRSLSTATAAIQAPNFASLQFVTIHFSRIVTPSNIHMKTSYLLAIAEFPAYRHNRVPQRSLSTETAAIQASMPQRPKQPALGRPNRLSCAIRACPPAKRRRSRNDLIGHL